MKGSEGEMEKLVMETCERRYDVTREVRRYREDTDTRSGKVGLQAQYDIEQELFYYGKNYYDSYW